jgi:ABC-type dipeptide/oligopeptide/nickel transport system permease component
VFRFLIRRLLQAIPTLLGVSIVVFMLIRISGDPTQLLLPENATPEDRALYKKQNGLDRPIYVQYVDYLWHMLQGDMGRSLIDKRPALNSVLERFPATLQLTFAAMLIVLVIGIPVGVISAVKRGSLIDRITMLGVLSGQSMATFWVGILLILVFAVKLRWFPVSGKGGISNLVLPAVTLSLYMTALTARMTRSSMLEIWGNDFVRTARAKGLREGTIVIRHGLRAALIPVVTVLGLQFGGALASSIVTESIFAWPGVGSFVLDAISKRDYPVVQAAVMVVATAYILTNLLVDLMYVVLDPRIREQ